EGLARVRPPLERQDRQQQTRLAARRRCDLNPIQLEPHRPEQPHAQHEVQLTRRASRQVEDQTPEKVSRISRARFTEATRPRAKLAGMESVASASRPGLTALRRVRGAATGAQARLADGVEFRILGPLEVADHGALLPLGGVKQRGLLAILLLNANEVVSADR